jgi:uncharacterized membrane protein YcaP (DUF421 family)
MDGLDETLRLMLGVGLHSQEFNPMQAGLRAAVVYVVTVFIVRLGKKRFMGKNTAFDVILGIMLGSTASHGITGGAPLLAALAGSAVLLAMHWLFSATAVRFPGFGWAIKGAPAILVRDGEFDRKAARKVHVTENDLKQHLRNQGISDLSQVAEVRMERSGELSVVKSYAVDDRFADVEDQFDKLSAEMATIKSSLGDLMGKVEALPRALAETRAPRD